MRLDKNGALHCLGLTFLASSADVKKAYRKLALRWHPDKCRELGAKERFQQVDDAYKFLQDLDLPVTEEQQARGASASAGSSQTYDDIFAELMRARQQEEAKKQAEQAQAREREAQEEKVRMQTPHMQVEFLAIRFKNQFQDAENCGRPYDRQSEMAAAGQNLVAGLRRVCEIIQQKQDFGLLKALCRAAIGQTIVMKSELILTKARQDLGGLVTSLCRHMFQHLDPQSSVEELSSLCDLTRDIVSEVDSSSQLPLYYSQCLLAYYKASFATSSQHNQFLVLDQQFNNLTARAGIWRLEVFAQYIQSVRAEASEDRQSELVVAEFMLLLRALAMMYQFSSFTVDFEAELQRVLSRLGPLFRSSSFDQNLVSTKVNFCVGGWSTVRTELQVEYASTSPESRGGLLVKVFLLGMKRSFEHYCTFSAKLDGYTVGQLIGFAKRESDFYCSLAPVFQIIRQPATTSQVMSLSVLSWLRHKANLGETESQWVKGIKKALKVVVAALPESDMFELMSLLVRHISTPAVVSKLLQTSIASIKTQGSSKILFVSRLFAQVSCETLKVQIFLQILTLAFETCLKDDPNASSIFPTLVSQCTTFSLRQIHEVVTFIIRSVPSVKNNAGRKSSTNCCCFKCDTFQVGKMRMVVRTCNHAIEMKTKQFQQEEKQSRLNSIESSKKEAYFFIPSLLVCAFGIGTSAFEQEMNRLLSFNDETTHLFARDLFAGAKELSTLHASGSLLLINRCASYLPSTLSSEASELGLRLIITWETERRGVKTDIVVKPIATDLNTQPEDSLLSKLVNELSLEKQLMCIQNRAVPLSLNRVIELVGQLQEMGFSAQALTLLNSCLASMPAYSPPALLSSTPISALPSFASISKPRALSSSNTANVASNTTSAASTSALDLSGEQETIWEGLSLALSLAKRCGELSSQLRKLSLLRLDPCIFLTLAKFLFDEGAFRECVQIASSCFCSSVQPEIDEQALASKPKMLDASSLPQMDEKSEGAKRANALQDQCLSLLTECFQVTKSVSCKFGVDKPVKITEGTTQASSSSKNPVSNSVSDKTKSNKMVNAKDLLMQDQEVKQVVGILCSRLTKVSQWVLLCESLACFPAALLHARVMCVQRVHKGCELQALPPVHISNLNSSKSATRAEKAGVPPIVAMFQLSWCPHQRCHSAACAVLHLALLDQLKKLRKLLEGTALQLEWNQCISLLGVWTRGKPIVHSELANLKLKPPFSSRSSVLSSPSSQLSSALPNVVSSSAGYASVLNSLESTEKAHVKQTVNDSTSSFSDRSDRLWSGGQPTHTPKPAPGTAAARLFDAINRNVTSDDSLLLKTDLANKLKIASSLPVASSPVISLKRPLSQTSTVQPKLAKTSGGSLSSLLERTKASVRLH